MVTDHGIFTVWFSGPWHHIVISVEYRRFEELTTLRCTDIYFRVTVNLTSLYLWLVEGFRTRYWRKEKVREDEKEDISS
jgi:hypothetical protein